MNSKVIYEKNFPPESPVTEEQAREDARFYQAMVEEMKTYTALIPLPHKIAKQNVFIEAAVVFSELYECDVTIQQYPDRIDAIFRFDDGFASVQIDEVIRMADSMDVDLHEDGQSLNMNLSYITHRRGKG